MEELRDNLVKGFLAGPKEEDVQTVLKRQSEQLLATVNMAKIVEGQRGDMELLKSTEANLEKIKKAYDPKNTPRESIEAAYTIKMQIMLCMTRRYHPLSSYGRSMIEKVMDTRREFEKYVGPYTVSVDADNVDGFTTVIPGDAVEDIIYGRSLGLGAIRCNGNDTYGVGAVVYDLEDAPDGKVDMRVRWLYVDPDFRGRGVVHSLIAELVYIYINNDISNIITDMSLGNNWLLILGFILNSWKFEFGTGLMSDAVVKVGDISQPSRIASMTGGVKSISEAESVPAEELVGTFLKRKAYSGYLLADILPGEYIDTDLSCFLGTEEAPTGLLLAHHMPSGKVRVDYLEACDEKSMVSLTCYFALEALDKCVDGTELVLPVRGIESGKVLNELFPIQKGMYIVEGVLLPPLFENSEEDIMRMVSFTDDELESKSNELMEGLLDVVE